MIIFLTNLRVRLGCLSCAFLGVVSLSWGADPLLETAQARSVSAYTQLAETLTQRAADAAVAFSQAVQTLTAQPDAGHLEAARKAWLGVRMAYLRTEPLRFSGGPIDDDDGPEPQLNPPAQRAAALEEMVQRATKAPRLSRASLKMLDGGALGFPVLAYLLWKSPRPFDPQRLQYLKVAAEVLEEDLSGIAQEWRAEELGNFRAMFVEDRSLGIQRMITGPSLLGGAELASSRLQLPLDAGDLSETTAPFSNTAVQEIQVTVQSLGAFWRCLEPFAKAADVALATQIAAQTQRMETLATQVPERFYEGGGDPQQLTRQLIVALEDQAASLRKLGQGQGLNIPLEVGPEGE